MNNIKTTYCKVLQFLIEEKKDILGTISLQVGLALCLLLAKWIFNWDIISWMTAALPLIALLVVYTIFLMWLFLSTFLRVRKEQKHAN